MDRELGPDLTSQAYPARLSSESPGFSAYWRIHHDGLISPAAARGKGAGLWGTLAPLNVSGVSAESASAQSHWVPDGPAVRTLSATGTDHGCWVRVDSESDHATLAA